MKTIGVLIIILIMFIGGCATTTRGLLRSANSYEQVYRACNQAASEVDFGVTSSDIRSGFIAAEMGRYINMSISVVQASSGTEVDVSIVPAPNVYGTGSNTTIIFNKFTEALKKRVPDVKVVFVK